MPRNILIVDDHPIFSDALALIINSAMLDVSLLQAHSLAAARAAIAQNRNLDLILLDLWLPDTHGFEGLIELRKELPKVPVAIMSAFADQAVARKALVCGAAGFIPKSASKTALVQALESILAGELVAPGMQGPEPDVERQSEVLSKRLESLTQQQLRVLQMLCQGLLNKQIAAHLDINETTVKAHVSEILRKLSVGSRTQAVLEVSKLELGDALALYSGEEAHNGERNGRGKRQILRGEASEEV